jgi:hypothetical protein
MRTAVTKTRCGAHVCPQLRLSLRHRLHSCDKQVRLSSISCHNQPPGSLSLRKCTFVDPPDHDCFTVLIDHALYILGIVTVYPISTTPSRHTDRRVSDARNWARSQLPLLNQLLKQAPCCYPILEFTNGLYKGSPAHRDERHKVVPSKPRCLFYAA